MMGAGGESVKAMDWINIVAILVAPLVAVQVSLWLERRKDA